MVRASPRLRMAWLSDDPIRPMPISATRSNIGVVISLTYRPMNLASAATTARLSSSVPMVMRSALGRP